MTNEPNPAVKIGLADFSAQRNWRQALGFYFFYLFVLLVICGAMGGIVAGVVHQLGAVEGSLNKLSMVSGQIAATIFCVALSVFLLVKKKEKGVKVILLPLATLVLTVFIGGLAGLAVPAYLTTRPSAP